MNPITEEINMLLQDALSHIISEAAEIMDDALAALSVEAGSWVIGFRGDVSVTLDLDAAEQRLVLMALLGQMAEAHAARVNATLLNINMVARMGGGVRMATDKPNGEVFLISDLFVAEMSEAILVAGLSRILQLVEPWSKFVATGELLGAGPSGGAGDAPEGDDFSQMIRV
jgi:hypothetical protein